ncbi:MAG: AsmA family protein [Gammaproteobacteria bacterium]|nr:AsmA family protein [Gammaproteobacteria bacterium]
MYKCLKWIAGIILGLIVLAIIAAIIIVKTINPNNYKPQIIAAVNKATGRSLSLPGNLSWSFFPSLGVHIGEASLSNAPGYAQPVFAQVQSAEVSVAVLPLLSGQLEANTLRLVGLQLNLTRKTATENNWTFVPASGPVSSTIGTAADNSSSSDSSSLAFVPLVRNLVISEANINYFDQTTGAGYKINQVNFKGQHIALDTPFSVVTSFVIVGSQPKFTANISAKAELFVDWQNQVYRLDSIDADANLLVSSQTKQNYSIDADVTGAAAVNLQHDTLTATPTISINKIMNFTGNIAIAQLSKQMSYSGKVQVSAFDLGKLMQSIGIKPPKFPNSKALSNVSLQGLFNGNLHNLTLSKLILTLNKTTFQGQFSIANFKVPGITLHVSMDKMDLSDYIDMNGASLLLENANLQAQANSQGWGKSVFPSTINGRISESVQQITLNGIDANAEFTTLSNAISTPGQNLDINALFKNLKNQFSGDHGRINPNNGKQTPFGNATLEAVIEQGAMKIHQIDLMGPTIHVQGSGVANLNTQKMNVLFYINRPQMKPSLTVPYRVSGDFNNPSEGIDWVLFQGELQKYLVQALGSNMQNVVQGTVNNLLNQLVNSAQH